MGEQDLSDICRMLRGMKTTGQLRAAAAVALAGTLVVGCSSHHGGVVLQTPPARSSSAPAVASVNPPTPTPPASTPAGTSTFGSPAPASTPASHAPPPTSTPTVNTPAGVDYRASAILARYNAFWGILDAASKAPVAARTAMLKQYATGAELKQALASMADGDARGVVYYGEPKRQPQVTQIVSARGFAVVRDCQDATHFGGAGKKTGRILNRGTAKNLATAVMVAGPDHLWRLGTLQYHVGSPC